MNGKRRYSKLPNLKHSARKRAGRRLLQAREILGLTQVDLAARARAAGWRGCSGAALSCAERGIWWPRQGDLRALEKAAEVKPNYFLSDEEDSKAPPEVEFPFGAEVSEPVRCEAVARIRARLHGWDETKKLGVGVPDPRRVTAIQSIEAAEERASLVRRSWHLGYAPLGNVRELFEEHGIVITEMPNHVWEGDPLVALFGRVWTLVLPSSGAGMKDLVAERWSLLRGLAAIYGGQDRSSNTNTCREAFARALAAPHEAVRDLLEVEAHDINVDAYAATVSFVGMKFGLSTEAAIIRVMEVAQLRRDSRQKLTRELRLIRKFPLFKAPAWRSWREAVRQTKH